jgi:hypothetical protein
MRERRWNAQHLGNKYARILVAKPPAGLPPHPRPLSRKGRGETMDLSLALKLSLQFAKPPLQLLSDFLTIRPVR